MFKLILLCAIFLVSHQAASMMKAAATCSELKLSAAAAPTDPVIRQVTNHSLHGEGPHWEPRQQVLLYVDIAGQAVLRFNPRLNEVTQFKLDTPDSPVSPVIPIKDSPDHYVIGAGRDLLKFHWLGESNETASKSDCLVLATVDGNFPKNRFNDGKADRAGNIWIGTMGPEPTVGNVVPDQGSLYRVSKSCIVKNKLHPVSISNGIAWSKNDDVMYYIDSAKGMVEKFDFNIKSGSIKNRTTVFDLSAANIKGSPDGMTIDANGNLWVAVFDGSKIINVDPQTGTLLKCFSLPVSRPTSVAFGGASLDTLYVTSSRVGLTEDDIAKQPAAGAVFEIKNVGATGVPMFEFAERNKYTLHNSNVGLCGDK